MKLQPTEFKDLYIIDFLMFKDNRGSLIKPWLSSEFQNVFGNNMETYITKSYAGSVRGLHYQEGIFSQKKIVVCISGKIEDVAIDMRCNSDTYGKVFNLTLSESEGKAVLIPEGFAHGVYAYEDSIFVNFSNKEYLPNKEKGILWSSVSLFDNFNITKVSQKDSNLPLLKDVIV